MNHAVLRAIGITTGAVAIVATGVLLLAQAIAEALETIRAEI